MTRTQRGPRRIPPGLKRLLLPLYNGGWRLIWRVGEYAESLINWRIARCAACGSTGPMLYRRRVIPDRLAELWGLSPRRAEALARKESLDCWRCGAKLRARRIAQRLLDLYTPRHASICAWADDPGPDPPRVAEINRVEGLHDQLARLPGAACSDFLDDARPGEIINGTRHENLMALTYADASFDLIVTSETLEHVPDLSTALAEIRRVLVPGGRHVFTVPLLPGVESTYARSSIIDGRLIHHAPPIRHPGGDVGYPVYTEFGADFPDILRRAGFEVEVHCGPTTEDDLAQVYVTRRPCG